VSAYGRVGVWAYGRAGRSDVSERVTDGTYGTHETHETYGGSLRHTTPRASSAVGFVNGFQVDGETWVDQDGWVDLQAV
jgi:hypothetical protein